MANIVTGGLGLPEEGAIVAGGLGASEPAGPGTTYAKTGGGVATLEAGGQQVVTTEEPPSSGGSYRPRQPAPVPAYVPRVYAKAGGATVLAWGGGAAVHAADEALVLLLLDF